jgi:hypothetical protein
MHHVKGTTQITQASAHASTEVRHFQQPANQSEHVLLAICMHNRYPETAEQAVGELN